jgi:cytochrome P450
VLLPLQRDALAFFTETFRVCGDRVRLRVLGQKVLLLSHPEDFETVLVDDRDSYGRAPEVRNLRPIFGSGLLASDGPLWHRQRRLLQPSFQRDAVRDYAATMLERIEARRACWRLGETLDVHREMMHYTRDVVCRTLFGAEPSAESRAIADAVTVVFGDIRAEILYLPIWRLLPTPRARRWSRAVAALNQAIEQMIALRRRESASRADLLATLLETRDSEGSPMSGQQIHDEILTLFLAGHETTALSLSWALALLAEHPSLQQRAAAEVDELTAGRPLAPGDYANLPFCNAIIQETLRLFPPVWSMGRQVLRDTRLAGHAVERGSRVWLCIHRLHRDPRWFHDPDRFDPDRWLTGRARPKFTFLPFGAGPRLCIGVHFAMMEAVLALASLVGKLHFSATPRTRLEANAWMTLRPRHGVHLRIDGR